MTEHQAKGLELICHPIKRKPVANMLLMISGIAVLETQNCLQTPLPPPPQSKHARFEHEGVTYRQKPNLNV